MRPPCPAGVRGICECGACCLQLVLESCKSQSHTWLLSAVLWTRVCVTSSSGVLFLIPSGDVSSLPLRQACPHPGPTKDKTRPPLTLRLLCLQLWKLSPGVSQICCPSLCGCRVLERVSDFVFSLAVLPTVVLGSVPTSPPPALVSICFSVSLGGSSSRWFLSSWRNDTGSLALG